MAFGLRRPSRLVQEAGPPSRHRACPLPRIPLGLPSRQLGREPRATMRLVTASSAFAVDGDAEGVSEVEFVGEHDGLPLGEVVDLGDPQEQ